MSRINNAVTPHNNDFARTILVAHEDDSVRDLLRLMLLSEGYQVISAATDREAIRQALAYKVDVLVTDLAAPGWCHQELLNVFQKRSPNTKIIAFSGMLAAGLLRLALTVGEDARTARFMIQGPLLASVRASLPVQDRPRAPRRAKALSLQLAA